MDSANSRGSSDGQGTIVSRDADDSPTLRPHPHVRTKTSQADFMHSGAEPDRCGLDNPTLLTTTVPFFLRLLGLQVSLTSLLPAKSSNDRCTLISEAELRALYMKALEWFIERECVNTSEAQLIFVGGAVANPVAQDCPVLTFEEICDIAAELPIDLLDAASSEEFDEFMFHAGRFFVPRSNLCVSIGITFVIVFSVLVLFMILLPFLRLTAFSS